MSVSSSATRARRLRPILAGLVLVFVAGLAWTPLTLRQASRALDGGEIGRAERWLSLADCAPWSAGPRALVHARLARLLSRDEEFIQSLATAKQAGIPPARLQREVLLRQAQAGEVAPLEQQLKPLLLAGEDLPQICEAYVLGCIMQFRIDQALATLNVWEADFPSDPQPHFLRGRLLDFQWDLEGAAREFRRALELAPRHVPAAMNLARVELGQQKIENALKLYQLAAEHLFEPQPALIGMARCYRELGRFGEARAVLQKASARPRERLVEAYRFVGERTETALAQLPAEMAQLELAEDHFAAAVPWLEQSLKANPQDWKIRMSYGQALRRVGRSEEARTETAKAEETRKVLEEFDRLLDQVRENSADVDARYRLGCILMDHLSARQGVVWLQSVLEYDAHHPGAHNRLSEYYAAHSAENAEFSQLARQHARQAQAGSR